MAAKVPSYVAPRKVPYFLLNVASAFKELTPQEKRYAHNLSTASWAGTTVCAAQVSYESPGLIKLFFDVFSKNEVAALKASSGVEADTYDQFVEYVALLYSNMGNFLSFGDTKFIPACDKAAFAAILKAGGVDTADVAVAALIDAAYDVEQSKLELGFPPQHVTSYYSAGITADEAAVVDEVLKRQRVEAWNTVVSKVGPGHFAVNFPSSDAKDTASFTADCGTRVDFVYGFQKEYFGRVVEALAKAEKEAANPNQQKMLQHYQAHFRSGDIEAHKESQRWWVKDQGPVVETNMGFIETYRDPRGVRGEWEGFVAVVNKEESKMYGDLVARAEEFICKLPWGAAFEKDVFKRPDFTSLELLSFASAGIPAGICIPNYDDVRAEDGFKNVYLANSVSAINFKEKMNHLSDEDWEAYKTHFLTALSVNVGVHELLGHGTGKLLSEDEAGKKNFDEELINPLTGTQVTTWYKPGETWGSVFGHVSNAYEECRAEAVSLYLALEDDVLRVFRQQTPEDCARTIHVLWLNMVRAGLVGLEFYSAESKQWRQAHMQARFCILRTLLEAPEPIVTIEHDAAAQKLEIKIDKDRIATHGKQAIGDLLCKLNIYKATADVVAGTEWFTGMTTVSAEFASMRDTVLALRKPRKQFVQPHTRLLEDGNVELVEFEASPAGAVTAMVARHKDIPL